MPCAGSDGGLFALVPESELISDDGNSDMVRMDPPLEILPGWGLKSPGR